MRILVALAAVLVAAFAAAGIARADGDPASDVLPTQDVYLPVAQPSADAASGLTKSVAEVYAGGDRIKVAVIATLDDMGSVPTLFNQLQEYARFLGIELSGFYVGPLLIVMPGGFGYYDGGRPVAAATSVLGGLSVNRSSSDGLVRSASAAVDKLRAADALKSPDIKAPTTLSRSRHGAPRQAREADVPPVRRQRARRRDRHRGRRQRGRSRSSTAPMQTALYSKILSLSWRAPKSLPEEAATLRGRRRPCRQPVGRELRSRSRCGRGKVDGWPTASARRSNGRTRTSCSRSG